MALHLSFLSPQLCFTHFLSRQPSTGALTFSGNGDYVTQRHRCLAKTQTFVEPLNERRSANYLPNIWSNDFVQSLKSDYTEEIHMRHSEKLDEVRHMLDDEDVEALVRLELIDNVQRLGLGYHFDNEIKRALHGIISNHGKNSTMDNSLHVTALRFRLLRQHGYDVSQDVLKSFKDDMGNFMSSISEDIKGLLSLYEASYLAFEKENLLDEAKAFTTRHLKDITAADIHPSFVEHVSHALELPLHWRSGRIEARWYIDAYEKNEDAIPALLELAKLDFNMVQATYCDDLKAMSKWWKDLGLISALDFTRDRLVETFLWGMGSIFEPQFAYGRRGLTKIIMMITTIDDIYDVYGTYDELELFTDAIERWDINAIESLPNYMKICFLALYNIINEFAYDMLKEQGLDVLSYLKRGWVDLCKAHLVEAKWYYNKYTPTLDEYLNNALITVSGPVDLVHAYIFLRQDVSDEVLEHLGSHPNLMRWSSKIFRLLDDLGTSTDELQRGDVPKAIQCYMHETGVCEEAAREHIKHLIDETWKKVNQHRFSDSLFPQPLFEIAMNLNRIAQWFYMYGDGYGAQDRETKDQVQSLLVDHIPMNEK